VSDGPGEQVAVAREVLDEIDAHARGEAPNECCGLLLGTADRIERCHPARNELASPNRYRIRAEDHFAAIREARRSGIDVIGAYHSHPRSAAIPSARDLDEAVGGGFLYVIAGLEPTGERSFRGWRLLDGNFVPVRFVTLQ
jgi:proteasome lid subunit RPN8/RPN11